MPTYTYICHICHKAYEEIQPITQYTGIGPLCCNQNMARTFEFNEIPTVMFKGHGWPSKEFKYKGTTPMQMPLRKK